LVRDAAWASLAGSLYGGVILVGFALALGARPATIGALSAIPLFAQFVQLPAIALVERIRQRRKIAVSAVTLARVIILSLAMLPFLPDPNARLPLLLGAQLCITMLGSVTGCSLNSWLHQLLPKDRLGRFFADRLFWSTLAGAIGAACAGFVIDHWSLGDQLSAYSVAFVAAGMAGFVSSWFLSRVPEPVMDRTGPPLPVFSMIGAPFKEKNFRRVIVFMMSWNVASNIAAPFIAVYVLQQLHYPIGTVTTLWISSQIANALTLYLWGRLSDRLSNKSILAVALPLYFLCLLALLFIAIPAQHILTLPLLYLIHVMMGLAAGGIGLATASLGLKLAPPAHATSYLASVSLSGSLAGGTASLFGGVLADWFSSRQMSLIFQWVSPSHVQDVTVIQVQHWGFLFAISFVLGFYVLHALSRISEGATASERTVIQQFVLEAIRSLDQLSSVESLRVSALFPFGRLLERRRQARKAKEAIAGTTAESERT
jgi:MFS family permease